MVRIVESDRMVIQKHRLRLLKGYPMLFDVSAAFGLIPCETQIIHMYIVHNLDHTVNSFLRQLPLGRF